MNYLNIHAVSETYELVVDAIESAKIEDAEQIEWQDAYVMLHDSMHDKMISAYHYGEPAYTKDLFLIFGEMLSIMHDGKAREVEYNSIINSVKERIKFLNGGEIMVWVNVYTITREYGGAEEGGWYYDWRKLSDSQLCKYEDAENIEASMREKYGEGEGNISSVLGGYEIDICIEGSRGASRSTCRPHYE
ncbi:hypothetical protein M5X00_26415 [Paenibacillus alvei]|uniref:hypothetical protein n=1 Tax=Paenibacillus alvei TaxID=44250 RepID=UPI0002890322|nr:hypothetical protein [Paenibacillus alvei]EJW14063.1 hypothetical protein PAV_141p01690 [Paenibacillus alvei DSM 29]MCY9544885.1 hypothetical protein [Paenibacillus alvei]MCY9707786.1 hypothetical protein [Paenibacillus alvei]MCY9757767.1 hypothetical protein [Paenibacillus alvei]MEC0082702.1 hypothetical protein [Paenibacillus alvei]